MSDILERLREHASALRAGVYFNQLYSTEPLVEEAASEIERLRTASAAEPELASGRDPKAPPILPSPKGEWRDAIEEAAKVADQIVFQKTKGYTLTEIWADCAEQIAADIRALPPPPKPEGE